MNYKIIVDSTFYLTEEQFKNFDVRRASLNVIDGEHTYHELDINNDFVFKKLDDGHKLTTSQPSPGVFLDLYEEALEEGADTIFVLTLSPPLSGTYQSASLARNMLDEPEKVHIFKSQVAAFGNDILLLELVEMTKQGISKEDIIKRINHLIGHSKLEFNVGSLTHIARSGRLSKTKAVVGSMLRIKPVLHMLDGKLDLKGVERTHKKIIASIVDSIEESTQDAKHVYLRVLSQNNKELADKLKNEIENRIKNIKLTFTEYLGPVFSLHIGKVGYGVAWTHE